MKKIILVMLAVVFGISGCIYQRELRPILENEEVWICEKPYAELYWGESEQCSKIIVDDTVYDVVFKTSSGPQMVVFEKEMGNVVDYDYCLFKGRTTYEKETAIVEVEEDFKNIFGGDLPTLKFRRYTKDEYLKDKSEK